jgi:phage/plasmid-associated DNA primase
MVSGEQMAIPKKFETATSVAWKTHGMFMGNEIASWCDNSGSMSRRIILGLFNEIVTDGNPKLFAELQAEMGHILLKCNRAYREAAAAFGSLDVWNVLPPYFAENRRKLRAETHALAFFLENCTDLHWDKKAYMSMDDIKLMMNVYLIADGSFKSQKRGFTSDFYQWVFDAYKIKVETDTRNYKGEVRTTNFITGVCDKNNQHFI